MHGQRRAHPRPPAGAKQAPKSVTKPEVRRLGIDVDDHFDAVYVVPDEQEAGRRRAEGGAEGRDELFLATDEDREGEAIGWHVLEVLKPKVPVKRMVFHEITQRGDRRGASTTGASST